MRSSTVCAKSALAFRDYEFTWKQDQIGRAAYEKIERSRTPPRLCKKCGATFHPRREALDQEFCSMKCFADYRRVLPERECVECGKTFHQRGAAKASRFCSPACYHKHRSTGVVRRCQWCSKDFLGGPAAMYCSDHCRAAISTIRSGKWKPARLVPPVFDYMLRCEGVRITDDFREAA